MMKFLGTSHASITFTLNANDSGRETGVPARPLTQADVQQGMNDALVQRALQQDQKSQKRKPIGNEVR